MGLLPKANMKQSPLFFPLLFFFIVVVLLAPACTKKTPSPDYPQLLGAWEGMTSQDKQIQFSISNTDEILYVTYYKIMVSFSTGGPQTLNRHISTGIVALNDKNFRISLGNGTYGEAYLDCYFNLVTMALTGSFRIYNPTSPNDYITGFYTAGKTK